MKTIFNLLCVSLILSACSSMPSSYVQAPSTAKVEKNVTAATQSNKQLKDLSNEERANDVAKDNKDQIISRWQQTHPKP